MEKILVLADIHMCGQGQTVKGLDPLQRLSAALEQAARRHPDAQHLILLGDIAHSGKTEEYYRVRQVLDAYPFRVTFMAGNHDSRSALRAVFPEAVVDKDGFLQSCFDIGGSRIITLDTLQDPHSVAMEYAGYLCPARMGWLRDQLSNAGNRRVLVFVHHPPQDIGIAKLDRIRLVNGQELIDLLIEHPNVEHLFCGHVHRPISGTVQGLGFTIFKSTLNQLSVEPKREDAPTPPQEPGAYGVVFLSETTIAAHSEDFDAA